ncbi:MAG: preprotein translocase subunit SecA [Acidimicrobiia bacterium]|nr:MAG: preprotein translocase subunit SecA [Acidimicrobiia bacterium]
MSLFSKALRMGEGKRLKELVKLAELVNTFEPQTEALSDDELAAKTVEFRDRYAAGESLDDLEAEAYAVVREAAKRTLGQRPFDVQVIGAGALHRGDIAEMKTGEGKTLVSSMPAYLNAIADDGVHLVTVNDYLARRDAEWMGQIHRFLGLTVGLIQADMMPAERKPQYAADITYGTNNEFGFDYLRDNMAKSVEGMTQRGHNFAIVDEVDSILVDEARTPLIISGQIGETGKWYREFAKLVDRLRADVHYEVDEKKRQVVATEEGVHKVEQFLGVDNMYDTGMVDFIHHLDVALKAEALYHLDVDYLIRHGEVLIVDEFTGRVLEGRRYSEGLHQAIEAKEGVRIKEENQTLATVTLQNYFRLYDKLAGMTGTAATEAGEFAQIYGLQVVEVPTNRPLVRADESDVVYIDEEHKYTALADDIAARSEIGQPVLVGTISIEKSEIVSDTLRRRGVKHEVLNAKHHEREAQIIAQAGQLGAVTVATNMAGRGVDIMLGGNPEELAKAEMAKRGLAPADDEYPAAFEAALERFGPETEAQREKVLDVGGLYVLGTERHDSRRIDNQLRGRSGRQGDPGESRFYLSLQDELMRRFANDKVAAIMSRLKIPPDVPIEHNMVSKAIERAQSQVEAQNFEIRKNVLKYDEVMNTQREIIYRWRDQVLQNEDTAELIAGWRAEAIENAVHEMIFGLDVDEWDWDEFETRINTIYEPNVDRSSLTHASAADVIEVYSADADAAYAARDAEYGSEVMRAAERVHALFVIDNRWREHLAEMDYLRSGIGLRAMGQRDPLVEYQREGFEFFEGLVAEVKHDTTRHLFHFVGPPQEGEQQQQQPRAQVTTSSAKTVQQLQQRQVQRSGEKIGRNEACPCGSGKKYKRCHGVPGAEPLA